MMKKQADISKEEFSELAKSILPEGADILEVTFEFDMVEECIDSRGRLTPNGGQVQDIYGEVPERNYDSVTMLAYDEDGELLEAVGCDELAAEYWEEFVLSYESEDITYGRWI